MVIHQTYQQKQHDIEVDDSKFESYYAYVQAYNEWKLAHKAYGIGSPIERDAYELVMKAQKKYKRLAKV